MSQGIEIVFEKDTEAAILYKRLAQLLLRRQSSLSVGTREAIASYVSYKNNTDFCYRSHKAAAVATGVEDGEELRACIAFVNGVMNSPESITTEGKRVLTKQEEFELVQIVAAFNMYNTLVTQRTPYPTLEDKDYEDLGQHLAKEGYIGGEE